MTEDQRRPLEELPTGSFLDAVASRAVAPSAGAVTALTGAMGAALCEMVAIHTSDPSPELLGGRSKLSDEKERLLQLADEDAAAVEQVQTAFERDTETDHPETALQRSTDVPLEIAETCRRTLDAAVVVSEQGTRNAVVDVLVGARLVRTALTSAATIVRTNLELVEDESYVTDTESRLAEAETTADEAMDQIRAGVEE